MDQNKALVSASWAEALARSEAELARGEVIPASSVHEELRQAIADMNGSLVKAGKRVSS